jgi:hypothetical protein
MAPEVRELRLCDLQCQRNPELAAHLNGIRVRARMPVKLLLYERSRGIATLNAFSLGIEVDDYIGGPVPINILKANLC